MARWVALAVVVALGAGPWGMASAEWNQLRGTAGREGVAAFADGFLDILGSGRLVDSGYELGDYTGLTLVQTNLGTMGMAYTGSDPGCVMASAVNVPSNGEVLALTQELEGCPFASMQAYLPGPKAFLMCAAGTAEDPVLQLRSTDKGTLLWSVSPIDLQLTTAEMSSDVLWVCQGAAADEASGQVFLGFSATSAGFDFVRHRIASIQIADGTVNWATQVQHGASAAGPNGQVLAEGGGASFMPMTVTLSQNGLAVSLVMFSQAVAIQEYPPSAPTPGTEDSSATQSAVAWLSRDGTLNGLMYASVDPGVLVDGDPEVVRGSAGGSMFAAASGSLVATALGDRLLIIDPSQPGFVDWGNLPSGESIERVSLGWAGPIWRGNQIFVPLNDQVAVFDSNDLTTYESVYVARGWYVDDILLTDTGSLFVLATRPRDELGNGGEDSILARIDTATRQLRQQWDFSATIGNFDAPQGPTLNTAPTNIIFTRVPRLTPASNDDLFVVSPDGGVVYLGPALEGSMPLLALSDPYVPVGKTVHLRVSGPSLRPITSLRVQWGDAAFLEEITGEANQTEFDITHAYASDGNREIVVTVAYAGGLTGTSSVQANVGG